ncbi:MAG: SIMPL domain-containing protein [Chloroflexi bacterium]|nr:SIMPL domain-containing protein [Chloroflexota bacterium]
MFTRLLLASGAAVSLAAVLGLAPSVAAQTIPTPAPPNAGITVLGSGIVLAQPDTARITLGVDITEQSLGQAQSEAAQRMDAVVAKLKADGIADSDIRTVAFNVTPQYDQQGNQNQPVLRGYEVQNMVEVRTTNVAGLGALLDDAVGAGATRIFGITFEASDMEGLTSQARDQAMANAQAKAQQLARNAGVGLGRPVAISESDTNGVTPVQAQPRAAAPAAAVTTPIQPGQLQITTMVTVTYAIQ